MKKLISILLLASSSNALETGMLVGTTPSGERCEVSIQKVKDTFFSKYVEVKIDQNIIYKLIKQLPEGFTGSSRYKPLEEIMKIKLDKKYKPNYTMNNYNKYTRKGKIVVPHVYLHMNTKSSPKDFEISFSEITPYSMVLIQNVNYKCSF